MAIETVAGELAGKSLDETEVLEPDTSGTDDAGGDAADVAPKRMSVRESITDAIAKASKPSEEKTGEAPRAAPGQQAGDKGLTTATQPTAQTTDAPEAWKSKEWKPLWDTMSPQVRAAIQKRETDMAKGVEQLRTRYQEIESVIAPNREKIRQFGFTEAKAIDQLFKWQGALAGPQKVDAFVALMQSHGLDPVTFAQAVLGSGQTVPPQNGAIIPPQVQREIEGIKQKLGMFEQHTARQTQDAATQTVNAWRKDKPHVTDSVMKLMGRLIQSGAAQPSESDPFALDTAYNMAVYADPETRALISAEEQEKAAKARKEAAQKAKKAGSSMRTGAPVPPNPNAGQNGKDNRNESPRQSIQRALAELRNQ